MYACQCGVIAFLVYVFLVVFTRLAESRRCWANHNLERIADLAASVTLIALLAWMFHGAGAFSCIGR